MAAEAAPELELVVAGWRAPLPTAEQQKNQLVRRQQESKEKKRREAAAKKNVQLQQRMHTQQHATTTETSEIDDNFAPLRRPSKGEMKGKRVKGVKRKSLADVASEVKRLGSVVGGLRKVQGASAAGALSATVSGVLSALSPNAYSPRVAAVAESNLAALARALATLPRTKQSAIAALEGRMPVRAVLRCRAEALVVTLSPDTPPPFASHFARQLESRTMRAISAREERAELAAVATSLSAQESGGAGDGDSGLTVVQRRAPPATARNRAKQAVSFLFSRSRRKSLSTAAAKAKAVALLTGTGTASNGRGVNTEGRGRVGSGGAAAHHRGEAPNLRLLESTTAAVRYTRRGSAAALAEASEFAWACAATDVGEAWALSALGFGQNFAARDDTNRGG